MTDEHIWRAIDLGAVEDRIFQVLTEDVGYERMNLPETYIFHGVERSLLSPITKGSHDIAKL